jgi:hypothetical protein
VSGKGKGIQKFLNNLHLNSSLTAMNNGDDGDDSKHSSSTSKNGGARFEKEQQNIENKVIEGQLLISDLFHENVDHLMNCFESYWKDRKPGSSSFLLRTFFLSFFLPLFFLLSA